MDWSIFHQSLVFVQRGISFLGIVIILSGILIAMYQYIYYIFSRQMEVDGGRINAVRLNLGRILILGLEFIVAADLIGTTTTPDYYSVGIVACIVVIRTVLSFTINREIMQLSQEK